MPAFLPPGQGVTVNLPANTVGAPASAASAPAPAPAPSPAPAPEPFRRVAGPDITLLPHAEVPKAPAPKGPSGPRPPVA